MIKKLWKKLCKKYKDWEWNYLIKHANKYHPAKS